MLEEHSSELHHGEANIIVLKNKQSITICGEIFASLRLSRLLQRRSYVGDLEI